MMLLGFISFTERLHIFASPSAFQILKNILRIVCKNILFTLLYREFIENPRLCMSFFQVFDQSTTQG